MYHFDILSDIRLRLTVERGYTRMSQYDRCRGRRLRRNVIELTVVLLAGHHLLVTHDHALLVVGAGHDVDDQTGPHRCCRGWNVWEGLCPAHILPTLFLLPALIRAPLLLLVELNKLNMVETVRKCLT